MNYLMISSHPYEGSFNAGIVKTLENAAKENGHNIQCIDLVRDGFNPVMTGADLKQWGQGAFADPVVKSYQDAIDKADILIFPFPIWWGAMPAVLKGFCDKILLPGWAYRYGDNGEMIGLLTPK